MRPLFKIIKESPALDITEALNINDPNRTKTRNTALRKALAKFRKAVTPKKSITVGMHYVHYTTLMQVLNLLYNEWEGLSNHFTDYEKCKLVWRQIIGYLQRFLSRIDRFAFARAFDDQVRAPKFKYGNGAFPSFSGGDIDFTGPGFDDAIYGSGEESVLARGAQRACAGGSRLFKSHVAQKLQALENLFCNEVQRRHDCLRK